MENFTVDTTKYSIKYQGKLPTVGNFRVVFDDKSFYKKLAEDVWLDLSNGYITTIADNQYCTYYTIYKVKDETKRKTS